MKKIGYIQMTLLFCLFFMLTGIPAGSAQSQFSQKIGELADKLTSSVSGKVIDMRSDVVYINLGEKDSIFEGAVFEVVRQGEPLVMDGETYYEETPVGRIQITKVRKKLSLANPIATLKPIEKGDLVYQRKRIAPSGHSSRKSDSKGFVKVSGIDLKSVHRRLENSGFQPGPFDGNNLTPLSEAVERFQKYANLNITGELDAATWKVLKKLYDPEASDGKTTPHTYDPGKDVSDVMKVSKIALMEFPHGDIFNDFTKNIYEGLSVYFTRKGFQVVERSQMARILKEQKISHSGIIDVSTAAKLGKLLGSEVALLGAVTDMGNNSIVRARLVDVEKGVAMTAAEVEIQKTPEITKMLADNPRLVGSGDVTGSTPAGTAGKKHQLPTAKGFPIVKKDKGFTFSLEKCEMEANNLTIHFLVTSNGRDKRLCVYNHRNYEERFSRIFDEQGIEHWPSNVFLSGKQADEEKACSLLISDVATRITLHFESIPEKAANITCVDLNCLEVSSDSRFRIQFRNIPITQVK